MSILPHRTHKSCLLQRPHQNRTDGVLGGPRREEWSEAGEGIGAEWKKTKTVVLLVQSHPKVEPAADSDINCPITQFTQFAQRLELFYSIFRDSTDLGQKPHGLRRISLRPYLLLTWPYDQPTTKMNNGKVFVCSKDKVLRLTFLDLQRFSDSNKESCY